MKCWFKAGFKYIHLAILGLIFLGMINTMHDMDLSDTNIVVVILSVLIILYFAFSFLNIFFERVVNYMNANGYDVGKKKGVNTRYLQDEKEEK
jgi:hypothetical protein